MQYRTLFLWIFLPLLPLIVGFVLLGLIDHHTTGVGAYLPGGTKMPLDTSLLHDALNVRFFNALLPYLAVALIHVFGCCALVAFLTHRLRALSQDQRSAALVIFGATVFALLCIGALIQMTATSGALNLGYRNVCQVLNATDIADHILPTTCTSKGLSPFAWLALLPLLSGLLTAALASAVTSTVIAPLDPVDFKTELERRCTVLDQNFKALAFVLVTSTLSLGLFYRLPLALIEDAGTATLLGGYAQAMTLYWAVLFTLTLGCIFGPGALMLSNQIKTLRDGAIDLETLPDIGPLAIKQRLGKILTLLSPVLLGASVSVLEVIANAL